jgi:hypothetical protein
MDMDDSLRQATDYLMDMWLDDPEATISLTEIRAQLEEAGSASRDHDLDAVMDRLVAVFEGCDGLEVSAGQVLITARQRSRLRKLFQDLDAIVDANATPDDALHQQMRRTTSHALAARRISVLDQLDEELASQRSKTGRV